MMAGVELSSPAVLRKVRNITFNFRHLIPSICSPKVTPWL